MKPTTYLNASVRYRPDAPATALVISTRAIVTIEPSYIILKQSTPAGWHMSVQERGYGVRYRVGRELRRAETTAEELRAAGLPVPPMPTAAECALRS